MIVGFGQNIREYNKALPVGVVATNWVNRGPGTSPFNPTINLQGQIFHYIGALMPPAQLRLVILPV